MDSEDEHRAARRAAGRSVAAALLGFTLKGVCILTACDELGTLRPKALISLKESHLTHEEEAFMDLAGTWAELDGVESSNAKGRILDSFEQLYPGIDAHKTRYGLTILMDSYGDAVRALAAELLRTKNMNGIECGKVILAHRSPHLA